MKLIYFYINKPFRRCIVPDDFVISYSSSSIRFCKADFFSAVSYNRLNFINNTKDDLRARFLIFTG